MNFSKSLIYFYSPLVLCLIFVHFDYSISISSLIYLGEYSDFFSISVNPFVSLTKKRQKRNPINVKAEKYQIEPYTFKSLLIMNSKVRLITVKFMN